MTNMLNLKGTKIKSTKIDRNEAESKAFKHDSASFNIAKYN